MRQALLCAWQGHVGSCRLVGSRECSAAVMARPISVLSREARQETGLTLYAGTRPRKL